MQKWEYGRLRQKYSTKEGEAVPEVARWLAAGDKPITSPTMPELFSAIGAKGSTTEENAVVDVCNYLGSQGWEIVSVLTLGGVSIWFKRPATVANDFDFRIVETD